MLTRYFVLAGLVMALAARDGNATECTVAHSFEVGAEAANAVLAVRVLRHQPTHERQRRSMPAFMDVEVLRVVSGTEARPEVRVWGGMVGTDPRVSVGFFPDDSYWLLNLKRAVRTENAAQWGWTGLQVGDYVFPVCGIDWKGLNTSEDAKSPEVDALVRRLTEAHRKR